MTFTLRISALRALRDFEWTPAPASVLIGANGAGKTTVLLALRLLRTAYDRSLSEAVDSALGGSYNLRNRLSTDRAVELTLEHEGSVWSIQLVPAGASVARRAAERLVVDGALVFHWDSLGHFEHQSGAQPPADYERLGIRFLAETGIDPRAKTMANFMRSITVFNDPDLFALRIHGSPAGMDRHINARGTNAFTMLRKWNERLEDSERVEFVRRALRLAFPELVRDFDFDTAAQTVTLRVFHKNSDSPLPIANEANGVLAMLVLLTEVAGCPAGGVVAIDEPENGLHPFAMRMFWQEAGRWCRLHDATLLLASHSPVLLDAIGSENADIVFALRRDKLPELQRLSELRDPRWLSAFRLGVLYADDNLVTNASPD